MLIFPLFTFITQPFATFMQIKYNGVYNTTSSDSCKLEKDVPSLGASQVVIVVKNPPANAGDMRDAGLISGLGRSPAGGQGNPLQYSCLENSMDRGAWQATVHRVTQSQTWLKRLSMHTCPFPKVDNLASGVCVWDSSSYWPLSRASLCHYRTRENKMGSRSCTVSMQCGKLFTLNSQVFQENCIDRFKELMNKIIFTLENFS